MTMKVRAPSRGLRSLILLGAALALIASACGGTDDTTTTTAAPTTTEAQATTTTTEAVEETTTTEAVALDPIALNIGSILPQTGALSSIIEALEEPLRIDRKSVV